jgi:hypothetical protein
VTALEEFHRDMSLAEYRGEYVLDFHAPGLQGRVSSPDREYLVGLAKAYGQMRRDQAVRAAAQ